MKILMIILYMGWSNSNPGVTSQISTPAECNLVKAYLEAIKSESWRVRCVVMVP